MPHIETVAPGDAGGLLAREYGKAVRRAGRCFNVIGIRSLNPPVMRASIQLYEALREVGWTDAQILTATKVVGFFNYYVRLVEALGVEPEPEMERDPEVWPDP